MMAKRNILTGGISLLVCISSTSCISTYCTQHVRSLGVVHEHYRMGDRITRGQDNSLAIEGVSVYSRCVPPFPLFGKRSESYPVIAERKRYLILPPTVVTGKMLRISSAVDSRIRESAAKGDWYLSFVQEKVVIPSGFLAPDASEDMLPPQFRPPASVCAKGEPLVFLVSGGSTSLVFNKVYDAQDRTKRQLWSYPCLLLMPVAVVTDASTSILTTAAKAMGWVVVGPFYLWRWSKAE